MAFLAECVGNHPDAAKAGLNSMLPVDQELTPAGIQIELPGLRPQGLALSPDGRVLVTSGQTHELLALDPASGRVLQHVRLPTDIATNAQAVPSSSAFLNPDPKAMLSFTGLIFSPDGARIYLANVHGDIKVFGVQADGTIAPLFAIPLPPANAPMRKPEIPSGLAVSRDGKRLYVALNLSNRFAEIETASGRLLRLWDVGVAPYEVVLAGRKAYVSNWGGRRPGPGDVTGPAGQGTRVRVDPVRFIASEGSVSIIDLEPDGGQSEILTGLHACALALSPNGHYVAVANAGSDTVSVIDTRTEKLVETIWARQNAEDLFGAQPNALAFNRSGTRLFVCNGTQNAVGVIDFHPGQSKLLGLIPAGWFPGAIAFDPKRQTIDVANIKGLSPGNLNPTNGRREFNSQEYNGSISLMPLPSARELRAYTQRALADMRYPLLAQAKLPARSGQPPRPVPERVGEPSVFKHVIYIIKENRTYDQVLGDVKEGDGDRSLCIFGERVTPNQHKLAHEFALLDHTYCSGSKSPDGHQWTDTAMATDYMEKSYAGFPRSYPSGAQTNEIDALAYSPAGFIWDDAIAHGKTLRVYGEFTYSDWRWRTPRRGKPGFRDFYRDFTNGAGNIILWSEPHIESLRPSVATNGLGWNLDVTDIYRAKQFIGDLKRFEQTGEFPNLLIVWLPNDHTSGVRPGAAKPASQVADNDLAVGQVVEAISHSSFWNQTCIFAIEDDPQAGWDHASAYRTTAYVASPYTQRGQVVSTPYNTTSLLRTIELILGLPPMNQMDATATPMFDCFTEMPDLTPFDAVPNLIPLDELNPDPKRISDPLLRKDAYVSAGLPLEKADQCPEDQLNRILWRAMKGTHQPYPHWAVHLNPEDD
ncbi:MAG TPA: alkaline phosphatase family protein [Candidatus Saccharimonadales bacterium]|nr:alkaline phosphatase family protein [Candidatus Saccharimonadales bacterium]